MEFWIGFCGMRRNGWGRGARGAEWGEGRGTRRWARQVTHLQGMSNPVTE